MLSPRRAFFRYVISETSRIWSRLRSAAIGLISSVTFARYLGTPEGTIYGYKLSGWDNLMARIAGEKADYAIHGLSFCGGHYIRGDGYSCAYIMGDTVAKKVVKRLKGGA